MYLKGGIYMKGYVTCTLKELLEKKGITRYRLGEMIDAQFATVDAYYKNKNFRYDAYFLAKVCNVLDCDISDLLVYVPASNKKK